MAIDATTVSIIAAQVGGIAELANIAGVNVQDIMDVLAGKRISVEVRRKLEPILNDLELGDLATEYDIDADEVADTAKNVNDILWRDMPEPAMKSQLLTGIAQGHIQLSDFDLIEDANVWSIDVFGDLTVVQAEALLEFMAQGNDISEGLALYISDTLTNGSIYDNVEESLFWKWYRENIYGEQD